MACFREREPDSHGRYRFGLMHPLGVVYHRKLTLFATTTPGIDRGL
jgi:hypothetical protein